MQLQLQQIATINIFDVIPVVAVCSCCCCIWLLNAFAHLATKQRESRKQKVDMWPSLPRLLARLFWSPSLVLISAHEWPAPKVPASYLYSIGQFIADASIASPSRSRKPSTLLGVGGAGTDCVSLTWCSGPNRWPTNEAATHNSKCGCCQSTVCVCVYMLVYVCVCAVTIAWLRWEINLCCRLGRPGWAGSLTQAEKRAFAVDVVQRR